MEDMSAYLHMDIPSENMLDINSLFDFLGPLAPPPPQEESFDINTFDTPDLAAGYDMFSAAPNFDFTQQPQQPLSFSSFDNGFIDPRLLNNPQHQNFVFENAFIPQYPCTFFFCLEGFRYADSSTRISLVYLVLLSC